MKKTVVIYKSKYGFTEKYAYWISQALPCDIYDRNNITVDKMCEYDVIVYGGGLYAGGVNGIDILTKNFDKIKGKEIILFTCGLADTENKKNTDNIKNNLDKVFTPEMKDKIKVFHLRGGMDYSKLGIAHKAMMAMLHKMVEKKPSSEITDEDDEMLKTYGKTVDFTDKESIYPIVSHIIGLE